MRILNYEQGSEEWYQARCGHPTSSCFDKIVDIKGNRSKQREGYLYQLAGERITKHVEEEYQNANMQRGKELEDEARKFYSLLAKVKVKTIGLCLTEGKYVYGASPDGQVGSTGLLEIKCPIMRTHVSYLLKDKLPLDYFQQTQGQLLVSEYNWVDFISYYPGMRPLIVRVKPDREFLGKLKKELEAFCLELDRTVRIVK